MINYILRKSLYGIVVLFLVVLTISAIIYLSPVDPAQLTQGQRTDTQTIEAVQKEFGLDQPLWVQLGMYLRDISPLDVLYNNKNTKDKYVFLPLIPLGEGRYFSIKKPYLRTSYQTGERVSVMLSKAIPQTIVLATAAILLACLIGIFLGVLAALRQNTWLDATAIVTSVMGYSLPSYVSAILLALIFGYYLQAYTGLSVQGSLFGIDDFGDEKIFWKNLILPAIALGIRPVGIITQLTRSSMLDVLSQDYIRTAKAKGLSKAKIVFKHALRNALNPVVTAVSGWLAALLAGAFFVENVFSYNGLGKMTVDALLTRDIPVVLGAITFTAVLFVVINLLVDVLYTFLDPRVKLS
ncbi:MAG: ABC transporter permease [Bacteroidota bacterium]